eukprot:Plantae.Rhodophyta-Hildenbrandia_rubra.ctg17804.p1 GENE.Plantae.Rhodophyta-Hildenbrandia_rubra.ctg17804~~Plantae.Rhodophyta-Hildenbrandia_rubra.ctg17804.p1  ORF type:complete len:284 (+),score=65.29 Plantae.Rhodophyta-Hildenbrandia_rubra.ctg17804:1124-1975(+)
MHNKTVLDSTVDIIPEPSPLISSHATGTETNLENNTSTALRHLIRVLREALPLAKTRKLHHHLLTNRAAVHILLRNVRMNVDDKQVREWAERAASALEVVCVGILLVIEAGEVENGRRGQVEEVVMDGVKRVVGKEENIWEVYGIVLEIVGKGWVRVGVEGVVGEGWSWRFVGGERVDGRDELRIGVMGNWGNERDEVEIVSCLVGSGGFWKIVGVREKVQGGERRIFGAVGMRLGRMERKGSKIESVTQRISLDFKVRIRRKESRTRIMVEWLLLKMEPNYR